MPRPSMCSVAGYGPIRIQVHTTHSQLRAHLSCPVTPALPSSSAAALPDNVLICWAEPLQGHQLTFGSWTHLFGVFKKVSFNSLWLWLHPFSPLKIETGGGWYLLYSCDPPIPLSLHAGLLYLKPIQSKMREAHALETWSLPALLKPPS